MYQQIGSKSEFHLDTYLFRKECVPWQWKVELTNFAECAQLGAFLLLNIYMYIFLLIFHTVNYYTLLHITGTHLRQKQIKDITPLS